MHKHTAPLHVADVTPIKHCVTAMILKKQAVAVAIITAKAMSSHGCSYNHTPITASLGGGWWESCVNYSTYPGYLSKCSDADLYPG